MDEHEIDLGGTQDFGCHAVYRDDMRQWWWVVSRRIGTPEIIATGPAPDRETAMRRGKKLMPAVISMLGDS